MLSFYNGSLFTNLSLVYQATLIMLPLKLKLYEDIESKIAQGHPSYTLQKLF